MSLQALRCPTCRAPLRAQATCPRCGTELTEWMGLLREAHALREQSRVALLKGDAPKALTAAVKAWHLWQTPRGLALLALALFANGYHGLARRLVHSLEAPEAAGE